MEFFGLIVSGIVLITLWIIWLWFENRIGYSRKEIKLNFKNKDYAYIEQKNIFLFPKRHRRILELYKPNDIIESEKSSTGFIKIKMDLNNFNDNEKFQQMLVGLDIQGKPIFKNVYLYTYEEYDPSSNLNRLEIVNDIIINIESIDIGEIKNYEINLTQINEKVEYIAKILEAEEIDKKEKELVELIKTALELAKSIPVPFMRTIVISLELLYKTIKYKK